MGGVAWRGDGLGLDERMGNRGQRDGGMGLLLGVDVGMW